jgi:hypothetical protein
MRASWLLAPASVGRLLRGVLFDLVFKTARRSDR